jgi:hypothetical protein
MDDAVLVGGKTVSMIREGDRVSTPGFLQLAGGDFAFEPFLSEGASGGGIEDVLAEVDVAFLHPPENDG